jgi:hypothetical protein
MTDAVTDSRNSVVERHDCDGRLLRGERQSLAVEWDQTSEHREGINRERLASPPSREHGPGDLPTHHGECAIRRDGVRERCLGVARTRANSKGNIDGTTLHRSRAVTIEGPHTLHAGREDQPSVSRGQVRIESQRVETGALAREGIVTISLPDTF